MPSSRASALAARCEALRNSSSAGPAVVQRSGVNFVCAAGRLNTANQSLQRLPQLLHSKLHALDVDMMLS
jgi:hypothetical protein